MFDTKAIELKSAQELDVMRRAGRIVAEVLEELSSLARPGATTAELDRAAKSGIVGRKAQPAFLGYRGFPATLCVSINSEVVHGIPSEKRRLKDGDIVSLDLGCIVDGLYADAAVTVGVGSVAKEARRLIDVTRESLEKGVAAVGPDARLGDVSSAIQDHAEKAGFSIVRDFVGHGIGRQLHEDPPVPNYGKPRTGLRLLPGMVLAIEPMVNQGSCEVKVLDDGWTAVTKDGALSAHFEHTVAVTEKGSEVFSRAA